MDGTVRYLQSCLLAVRFSTLLPPKEYDLLREDLQTMLTDFRGYLSANDSPVEDPVRLIAALYAQVRHFSELSENDTNSVTDALLCVLDDPRFEDFQNVGDISQFTLDEIEHFFVHYKDLEPGKEVKGSGWGDKAEAERILQEAIDRHK